MKWIALLIITVVALALAYAHAPEDRLPLGIRADKVLVLKGERKLILIGGNREIRQYRIALGGTPVGHKTKEGDGKTLEGQYVIDYRKADSSFHKALHVSYPNHLDKEQAEARNVPPGGLIMIHGIRNGVGIIGKLHRFADWTNGCIAVSNTEIEEIWAAVQDGTPIEIRP